MLDARSPYSNSIWNYEQAIKSYKPKNWILITCRFSGIYRYSKCSCGTHVVFWRRVDGCSL